MRFVTKNSSLHYKTLYIYRYIYIYTEKYSPKSYVVNFHTQMSSSQSEERIMVFTREEIIRPIRIANDVFWRVRKNSRLFLQLAAPLPTHSTRKVFLEEFFVKKVKNILEWNSFVCFTIDKENCREPVKQQRKGERDVSLCCAFCPSYFVFHLSISLYSNRPFYLGSVHKNLLEGEGNWWEIIYYLNNLEDPYLLH